jgi:DNA polymerase-3 subunit alpha
MCGMITNYRKFYTKNGKQMMTFTLEDLTGSIDVVCFARNLNSLKDEVQPDEFFVCYGTVGKRDNLQLRLDQVQKVSLEKMKESALESNHFEHQTETFEIKIPKETSKTNLTQLKEVLSTNPGNTPVCLQMENLNGSIKHIKLKSGITLTPAVKSQIMSLLK